MCLIAQTLDNVLHHEDYFFNVKNKVIYELIYTLIVMKKNVRATSLCQQSWTARRYLTKYLGKQDTPSSVMKGILKSGSLSAKLRFSTGSNRMILWQQEGTVRSRTFYSSAVDYVLCEVMQIIRIS